MMAKKGCWEITAVIVSQMNGMVERETISARLILMIGSGIQLIDNDGAGFGV